MIVNELTQSQIDQINKTMQAGGRLVIKPTRKQVEGGFLGTLASIGIPIAISLVSPPPPPNPYSNVYLPQSGGKFPMYPSPFYGNWDKTIGMVKRLERVKKKGQGLLLGKNSPFNAIPILGSIL